MSKISVNTFEKGMNLDTSRVVQKPNTAFDISNFRPWTDEDGKAVGGLLNIKGNELSFRIPDTSPIYQFVFTFPEPTACPATTNLLFELGSGATLSYNPAVTMCGSTQAEIVQSAVDFINADATLIANNIRAYVLDTDTMLVAHLGDQDSTFNVSDGSIYLAKTTYLASQTDVQIIGWTTIRDDYYLFTTNDTSTTGGPGQIWKLEVSEVDKSTTLSLVYNGQVDFSTKYPIEAIGRYENDCTKRLYWTDNFNVVRTIQTEATDVFFTDPDNLGLIPALTHSIPVLQSIQSGGTLKSGIWQFAYRLRTATGGESSFSPVSRMVPLVSSSETDTNYWEYLGEPSGNNTGKSVTIKIDRLDEDYDYIEVVSLYKASKNSTPVITSVATEPIDLTGEFEITISGTELNSYELSLEEFLLASRAFTHAKTITSKDNRLFAANTKYEGLDVDLDTRAYGHLVSSTTFNVDSTAYTSLTGPAATDNCINDDYSLNKFARNSTNYGGTGPYISYEIKTKAIEVDNKNLQYLGVSYESLPIRNVNTPYSSPLDLNEGVTYPQPTLWQGMKNPYTFDLYKGYQRDEIYRFAIVFYDKQGNPGYAKWIADIKIPEAFNSGRSVYSPTGSDYVNGNFRGRTVEQVGGKPYFNIPYIEFTVANLPQDVLDKITGYSIVRVERRDEDRTIVGQGLAFKTGPLVEIKAGATKSVETPLGELTEQQEYLFALAHGPSEIEEYDATPNQYDPSTSGLTDTTSYSLFDYDSYYLTAQFPEHLYTGALSYLAGDKIKTVDVFSHNNVGDYDYDFDYEPTTDFESICILKQLDDTSTGGVNTYSSNIETVIDEYFEVADGAEIDIDGGRKFRNEIFSPFEASATKNSAYHGWGQKTILIKTTDLLYQNTEAAPTAGTHPNIFAACGPELLAGTGTNTGGTNGATAGDNFYVINYTRTLASQYGGNSYNSKTQNIYISTGQIVQVDETFTTTSSYSVDVFGGDTFMTLMDTLKARKSWDYNSSFATPRRSLTYLFAVESPVHTEMRHGKHVQSHLFAESGSSGDTSRGNDTLTGNCDTGETYSYNKVYSTDNNIIKFYAKPFDFQESDCTEIYDTRIYASEPKVNGETIDSWQKFGTNEFIDLESLYGPINKIITHNDTFFTFQDRATATVAVNPRIQTTVSDGTSLELGTGGVLHDFTYVSNSVGCKHQWGIIPSRSHLYWIDINNNKLYKLGSDGLNPLSDMKGLFSYLDKNLVNDIRLNELNGGDNPIEDKGINGYYDYENNEVVFTAVGNGVTYTTLSAASHDVTFEVGTVVYIGSNPYVVNTTFTYNKLNSPEYYLIYLTAIHSAPKGFTICYNEFIQAFSSFYTFESPVYLYNPLNLFSVDSKIRQDIYLHNEGPRGEFYGYVNDSHIKFYLNDMPIYTKVFDNLLWHTESVDNTGSVVNDDTFYQLKCNTTYQQTDYTNLINNNNLKRKERTWQTYVPRSNANLERMRDKHMEVELYYDNTDDNRFLVHLVGNVYRPSFR